MAGIGTPELTVDDLAAVQSKAWRARHKWYNIGLELGLKADDLDCIQMSDPGSCFREMLKQWLRQERIEKTWDKLIKALQSETVNYGALANSIATQGESVVSQASESATNWVDHDPTPKHYNEINVSNASKINDSQQSNQYADHRAEHDQCTAMFESLAIEKPKRRGFICPCGQCSIEQVLETGCPRAPQTHSKPYPFLDTENLIDHGSRFEVPQGIFARNLPDGEILAFKVTSELAKSDFDTNRPLPSTLETSSKVLNLDPIAIQGRIVTSLGLKDKWSLVFLRASKGCVELHFSIPTSLFRELKPQLNITEATELNPKTGIASLEVSGIHLLCGPPGKPYVSEVTNDSQTVTLNWSKPEYTGLHPPTGYRIYYRSTTDQSDKWMMSTEGPVESLVVGTLSTDKGSFIVQAINEIGAGVMSEESDLMILTTRGIPSSLVTSGLELEREFDFEDVQEYTVSSLLACGSKSSSPAISQEVGSNWTASTVAVPSVEEKSDSELVKKLNELVGPEEADQLLEWMSISELRIVVAGKTGVGKSTLLNTLLGFDVFTERDPFRIQAVTTHVEEYRHMRNGVKITVWDCTGLHDNYSGNEDQYLKELTAKTKGDVHLMLYCINMLESRSDLHWGSAIDRITSVLGKGIWKNTALVLTFANAYELRLIYDKEMTSKQALKEFNEKIKECQKKFQEKLRSIDGISRSTIDKVTVLPAGKYSHIPLFGNKDWFSELWAEMLTRVNDKARTAVLRLNADRFREPEEDRADSHRPCILF
jgi:predicted GTPase